MAYKKQVDVGVSAYLTASDTTTITTAGTYYPIAGTFDNDPIEYFSLVAGPSIQYDYCETKYFEVDWHATVSGDSASITTTVGIKKNTTVIDDSKMQTFLKNLGQKYAVSGTTVVSLACNDTIQLVCTSDGDGDVLTFHNFTTTIREFYNGI